MKRFMFTLFCVALTVAAFAEEKLTPAPEGTFTVAVIPDTQYYLGPGSGREEDGEPRNPPFLSRTTWLAENIDAQRIVFVTHMGDIVDKNEPRQWKVARACMDVLHGKVPYGICVGNHDMVRDSGDASLFQHMFGAERYAGEPWYGGTYDGDDAKRYGNNVNSYQLFSAGGLDFIIVHIECNAPDNVLAWADDVLEAHSGRMAIITSHMYLGGIKRKTPEEPQGRMAWKKVHGDRGNTPEQLWDKCFSKHANLFLVLCGDQSISVTHHQESRGVHGNLVHEVLMDYPRVSAEEDWLRLLRFDPAREVIEVWTYSPVQGRLCDSVAQKTQWSDHQFTLDIAEAMTAFRTQHAPAESGK